MIETPNESRFDAANDDGYPLATSADSPDDIARPLPALPQLPEPSSGVPPGAADRQFSLSEFLIAFVVISVTLSVASTVMHFFPGGASAGGFAGGLGIAALLYMIVLAIVPTPRHIVAVAWWMIIVLYVMTCGYTLILGH